MLIGRDDSVFFCLPVVEDKNLLWGSEGILLLSLWSSVDDGCAVQLDGLERNTWTGRDFNLEHSSFEANLSNRLGVGKHMNSNAIGAVKRRTVTVGGSLAGLNKFGLSCFITTSK